MQHDYKGMTPLHYASASGVPYFFEYVTALLEAKTGADRLPLYRLAEATSGNLSEKSLKIFF